MDPSIPVFETPWFSLRSRPNLGGQPYYYVQQLTSVAALARTKKGEFLVVSQIRPAMGGPVLEIPAGAIDPGETPDQAVLRELEEETGYRAQTARYLGAYAIDQRLSERLLIFFCDAAEAKGPPEPGLELLKFSEKAILRAIETGELAHISAAAAFGQAKLCGLLGKLSWTQLQVEFFHRVL
ncbi:MAG: hypothetical protein A2527_02030 [Candidatus Lambdaproteobacteria bacterium RIFOXYD2_FULL_50_16]|uniref:GDP-mannose pyrophosphatase n=1 Tax=Candidatus Lambdaproteobacteria bacterium RIFOXYD2_FULL_50_16 TaxID=1817772 RepID=A0A1F6GE22_9PROT|nr:MAG: hypothetical protein A2527_02030 [Candidatus Lambdaproteobacteria bacterium RIFOXYD2_FULL_50_16]